MVPRGKRNFARLAAGASAIGMLALSAAGALASGGGMLPSGGVAIGGLAPTHPPVHKLPSSPGRHAHGHWLSAVTITEYWPSPESWFEGALVSVPGLSGKHRIDWLYSATGVSMQGEGYGLDGRMYHINSLGSGGWVTSTGQPTSPADGWSGGSPYWRAGGYWANATGAVTFPLARGGWSGGQGRRYVPLPGVTFADGPSLPLRFYQSIAVDPRVIPLGSRVYIPAYRNDGHGGWFIAQDTGGAITGHHVDVYRSPPTSSGGGGHYLTRQHIFVVAATR